jgi:hypothetical protein
MIPPLQSLQYSYDLSRAWLSRMSFPSRSRASHMLTMRITRSLPTHLLFSLCMLVAGVTLGLHTWHVRQRRDIYLTQLPGSIGSALALTSHSGFGQLLMPYDDRVACSRALAPLRFCLDRRTGAIVVDESVKDESATTPILGRWSRNAVKRTFLGRRPAWWKGRSTQATVDDRQEMDTFVVR